MLIRCQSGPRSGLHGTRHSARLRGRALVTLTTAPRLSCIGRSRFRRARHAMDAGWPDMALGVRVRGEIGRLPLSCRRVFRQPHREHRRCQRHRRTTSRLQFLRRRRGGHRRQRQHHDQHLRRPPPPASTSPPTKAAPRNVVTTNSYDAEAACCAPSRTTAPWRCAPPAPRPRPRGGL